MKHHVDVPRHRPWPVFAIAALTACGGGEFTELLAHLLSARFTPSEVSVPRGGSAVVQLDVQCDYDALNALTNRLRIELTLDPQHRLPAGVTVTPLGGEPSGTGAQRYRCDDATNDPALRAAHIGVRIDVAPQAEVNAATLLALLEIEPILDQPPKDSTTAQLAVQISGTSSPTVPGRAGNDNPIGVQP
jgi:hypothetical protein